MPKLNQPALDFLLTRRSLPAKTFTTPVPDRPALEVILTAALRVPDHGKLEPWRLLVLERPALLRLADLAEARAHELGADAEKVGKARGQFDAGLLAVAVISSPKPSDKVPVAEQVLSAGALCMTLVAAATAAGWGACWLTGWPAHDAVFAARAFGCTEVERVAGLVHIATPTVVPPDRPRPDISRVVTWVPA
jgi:nitroreductase